MANSFCILFIDKIVMSLLENPLKECLCQINKIIVLVHNQSMTKDIPY